MLSSAANFITQTTQSRSLQDLSIALLWHLRTFVIVNYAATRIGLMHVACVREHSRPSKIRSIVGCKLKFWFIRSFDFLKKSSNCLLNVNISSKYQFVDLAVSFWNFSIYLPIKCVPLFCWLILNNLCLIIFEQILSFWSTVECSERRADRHQP